MNCLLHWLYMVWSQQWATIKLALIQKTNNDLAKKKKEKTNNDDDNDDLDEWLELENGDRWHMKHDDYEFRQLMMKICLLVIWSKIDDAMA